VSFDVTVVGAGPAGCAAAVAIAAAGARVALVDRERGPPIVETLPGVARAFLAAAGLPRPSSRHRVQAGMAMAWAEPALTVTSPITSKYGSGWILYRAVFDAELRAAAEQRGVVGAARMPAPLTVDATGRAAAVAREGGARWRAIDRLIALVFHVPRIRPPKTWPSSRPRRTAGGSRRRPGRDGVRASSRTPICGGTTRARRQPLPRGRVGSRAAVTSTRGAAASTG
jgi:choline dehydrogenase-like flavoprotein